MPIVDCYCHDGYEDPNHNRICHHCKGNGMIKVSDEEYAEELNAEFREMEELQSEQWQVTHTDDY